MDAPVLLPRGTALPGDAPIEGGIAQFYRPIGSLTKEVTIPETNGGPEPVPFDLGELELK